MSGYPNPNYAPMPTYPSNVGESCDNPKPYWFWKGGTFCGDVNIKGTLDAGSVIAETLSVTSEPIVVAGTSYSRVLFQNPFDGLFYYVLAAAAPEPAPLP